MCRRTTEIDLPFYIKPLESWKRWSVMLIRKDKSCLCWFVNGVGGPGVTVNPTMALKQWSSQVLERSVYVQVRDWFCLSCMDYGLLEALIYYYYLKKNIIFFDQKLRKIFFLNYVYIWLIFWENVAKFFYQKIGKKDTPESWSLWNKYFQNLVVYYFSKKAATMLPKHVWPLGQFIFGVLMWGRFFSFMLIKFSIKSPPLFHPLFFLSALSPLWVVSAK
jgi:hypothetical protein